MTVGMMDGIVKLLTSMHAEVVRHWHLPLEEVREWGWTELREAHTQVRRERYDQAIAETQQAEHAYVRGYVATHSRRRLPAYKTFDEVADDIWGDRHQTPDDPIGFGGLSALYAAQNLADDADDAEGEDEDGDDDDAWSDD